MAESTTGAIANVGTAERPAAGTFGLGQPNNRIVIDVQDEAGAFASLVGKSPSHIFPIHANLPERFHMELSSQWGTPLDKPTIGEGAAAVGQLAGMSQRGAQVLGDATNFGMNAAGVGTSPCSVEAVRTIFHWRRGVDCTWPQDRWWPTHQPVHRQLP